MKIPMGEGVAAGDVVGDRVVSGAVGSAMDHGKMQSVRDRVVITVRFRHGSARLDNEDPTNRHLG